MDTALNKTLGSLPADTKVYDGHNYSQGNVKFAVHIGERLYAMAKMLFQMSICRSQ